MALRHGARHGVVTRNSRYLMLLDSSERLILIFAMSVITVWSFGCRIGSDLVFSSSRYAVLSSAHRSDCYAVLCEVQSDSVLSI